ncbi:unnamed protein product [Owenia fusiformis]|uniref:Uncharacterized protein n=1 Tax=Owenia fusiformis TaxID=6347 RepID=A0A8J1UYW2_OWEFU|nr:unnamed protein product [Owenia fusiformis]
MGSSVSVSVSMNNGGKCLDHKMSCLINRQINDMLKAEHALERRTMKLLILGASDSGKSTFSKQMKILHHNGFSEDELIHMKSLIYSNTIQAIYNILDAMENLEIELEDPQYKRDAESVEMLCDPINRGHMDMTPEIGNAIRNLWTDKGVQKCFQRSNEYQLDDSTEYFMTSVERISAPHYIPTEQDILRSRISTTGIVETNFQFKGHTFRMFDVGGQRSQRRKWIHCFDNVTALLFIAAMSAYNQVLREDATINRMKESLMLFSSITNSGYFKTTELILFLNKKDIFEQKISQFKLSEYFPNYRGGNNFKEAAAFIRDLFEGNLPPKKLVYTHYTTAIDTKNIQVVFNVSMASVLRNNLEAAGMLL